MSVPAMPEGLVSAIAGGSTDMPHKVPRDATINQRLLSRQ
jgi:hypothetical protein